MSISGFGKAGTVVATTTPKTTLLLPRTETSYTDDPYWDVLPDISHFIMLEITTRKETFIHLNAVEVIYLTIKWKKKKSLLYR